MNKLFKRVVSGVMTAAMAVSGVTFSALNVGAVEYEVSVKNQNKVANLAVDSSGSPIIVWVNGGKASYSIGDTGITVDVDGKTANVDLTAAIDEDNYNITAGKNIFWGVATASDGVGNVCYYQAHDTKTFQKPATSLKDGNDEIFKVAKGKVTAGKKAGTGYLGIYIENKKDLSNKTLYNDKATYTLIAKIKVDVKQAPSAIGLSSDSSGTITNANKVTKATVGLNAETAEIFVHPTKAGEVTPDTSSTYTVKVDDKSKDFVTIVGADEGTNGLIKTLSSGEAVFQVTGVSVKKDVYTKIVTSDGSVDGTAYAKGDVKPLVDKTRADKNVTATVIVTNNQSGKSSKVAVTVTSGISSVKVSSDGIFTKGTATTGSDGYYASENIKTRLYADKSTAATSYFDVRNFKLSDGMPVVPTDSSGVAIVTQDDVNFTITAKPTVGVFKSMPTASDLIANGKLKFNYGTGTASIKGTSTLALDSTSKSNAAFKLTPKKQNYTEPTVEYAVIAYGPSMDQILIIPFVIKASVDDIAAVKIDTVTFKAGLASENATNKKLQAANTTTLTKTTELAFTVTTKLGTVPTVTASDGTADVTSTALKFDTNGKVTKITVAENTTVYVTVAVSGNSYTFEVKGKTETGEGGSDVDTTISSVDQSAIWAAIAIPNTDNASATSVILQDSVTFNTDKTATISWVIKNANNTEASISDGKTIIKGELTKILNAGEEIDITATATYDGKTATKDFKVTLVGQKFV